MDATDGVEQVTYVRTFLDRQVDGLLLIPAHAPLTCPVRPECAAHALTVQEPYGVWGGFTETERLRLRDLGWHDLVDRRRGRADVPALERRLPEDPPTPTATPPPSQRTPTQGHLTVR